MKLTTSYKTKIIGMNRIFDDTLSIYRSALKYCIELVEMNWDDLSELKGINKKLRHIEVILVGTKQMPAQTDFPIKFGRFPSYLRREVINTAIGIVSSYQSNYEKWEVKKEGNAPTLQYNHHNFPSFFHGNMYRETKEPLVVKVKLYHRNKKKDTGDWLWYDLKLRNQDVKYITHHCSEQKKSSPALQKIGKAFFLRYSFEQEVKLNKTELLDPKNLILAIDLGVNTDATCCVMKVDGTVIERNFINFSNEKAQLYHTLNKIKKHQRIHGSKSVNKLWNYAKRCNDELARKIANSISSYVRDMGVCCVVFEHLNMTGKKRGSKKQKLHMWKKNAIQDMVERKVHAFGCRLSRVCASYTSKLAYDGSGEITRDKKNYSLATFATGKQYNADLSASYNIGARYYIRAIQKSIHENEWSVLQAQVPDLQKRTTCTLSSLKLLCKLKEIQCA